MLKFPPIRIAYDIIHYPKWFYDFDAKKRGAIEKAMLKIQGELREDPYTKPTIKVSYHEAVTRSLSLESSFAMLTK